MRRVRPDDTVARGQDGGGPQGPGDSRIAAIRRRMIRETEVFLNHRLATRGGASAVGVVLYWSTGCGKS